MGLRVTEGARGECTTHLFEVKVPSFEFSVLFEDVLAIFGGLGCGWLGGGEVRGRRGAHDDVSVLWRAHRGGCCATVRSCGLTRAALQPSSNTTTQLIGDKAHPHSAMSWPVSVQQPAHRGRRARQPRRGLDDETRLFFFSRRRASQDLSKCDASATALSLLLINFSHSKNARSRLAISFYGNTPLVREFVVADSAPCKPPGRPVHLLRRIQRASTATTSCPSSCVFSWPSPYQQRDYICTLPQTAE